MKYSKEILLNLRSQNKSLEEIGECLGVTKQYISHLFQHYKIKLTRFRYTPNLNCYICGCIDKHVARGFCSFHYEQVTFDPKGNRKACRKYASSHRESLQLYRKKYRQTKNGREATLRAIRKYETNHPERRNAWNKANKLAMMPCVKCGKIPTHRHHLDPLKPLNIIFLCPLHHKEETHY